jgi:hypothetical protein
MSNIDSPPLSVLLNIPTIGIREGSFRQSNHWKEDLYRYGPQENFSKNGAPLFDGTNYTFWRIRMRIFLMALGYDI